MKSPGFRFVALNAFVAVVYFAAAELGLSLAFVHSNVSLVWPPTGIALAALLIFGKRLWPAIFIGAFFANLAAHTSVPIASGIAFGNTLEAVFAVYLLRGKRREVSLNSIANVGRFVICAAVAAPIVSATIGTVSLCLGGAASWTHFISLWLIWWLGDGFGALIVTPLILSWTTKSGFPTESLGKIGVMMLTLFVICMIIFGGWFPGPIKTYPLAYLCLPFLLWACLKFDQRIVTAGILLLAGVSIAGAKAGYGPFVRPDPNVSLLLSLSFIGTVTLMTLILFAVMSDRRKIEQEKEKLRTEVELHRRRVEDIVAHVPGVVWEAWGRPDASSQRIDFVSGHVETMLGYSEEEWLSTPNFWLTVVHPDDKDRAAEEAAAIFASRRGGSSRFRWVHKGGREIWVEAHSIVVLDENGEPIGMRGITTDISAAVQAENDRADLLRREQSARAQAEEASRLKEEFLATVSHELRTPLSAVLGWARLLRTGQLDQKSSAYAVEVIERNASTQKQIIEDLLDVSRITSGKLRVNTQPVDLHLVIHAAIDVVRPAAEAKGIVIRTEFSPPDIVVRGDADRIQQVAWNLLSNAVKFTPKDGTIDVYLTLHGSQVEIRIEDSGPGIPVDFLPRIFDRFSQADGSTTRKHGGLGLGLAIVRHLVELHGGTVAAGNKEGNGGAVLIVRLPAAESTAADLIARPLSRSVEVIE